MKTKMHVNTSYSESLESEELEDELSELESLPEELELLALRLLPAATALLSPLASEWDLSTRRNSQIKTNSSIQKLGSFSYYYLKQPTEKYKNKDYVI